jgi:hypothetical protein
VQWGALEIARRFYVAVRDSNWNTVPADFSDLRVQAESDRFDVTFTARHVDGAINFTWEGSITGLPDGAIVYAMRGLCHTSFRYNKIGICLHHPFRECEGRTYRGLTPDGEVAGSLPVLVAPQRLVKGIDIPLFPAVANLTIDLDDHFAVNFVFEGDLFEMEDHRNWTDASFKTYSTPEALGFPHEATAGQQITQKVTMTVAGRPRTVRPQPAGLSLELGRTAPGGLPTVGLGMASHVDELSTREAEVLRVLRPNHVRVDLDLADANYPAQLARAWACCQQLDCRLEIALFVTDNADAELAQLASRIDRGASVVRFLVFHKSETSTDSRWVRLAKQVMRGLLSAPAFAAGTNYHFADLNRSRPDPSGVDEMVYPITPQFHATDDLSLIENLEAQAETVRTVRTFAAGKRIVVSPVTLKPRFNAVATSAESESLPDDLPSQVDARQMSLFGAAWTAVSVKYLAESGAGSVTYYETTGWRGVMETAEGPPLPQRFPSIPRQVFPLYHVLADVSEWTGGQLVECQSNTPRRVNGLAVRHKGQLHLLVANMTAASQHVTVGPLDIRSVLLRELDDQHVTEATLRPEPFRSSRTEVSVNARSLKLTLAPHAVVRVDAGGDI